MFDPSLSNTVISPADSINQYELGVNGANTTSDIKGKVDNVLFVHSTEYSNVEDVFCPQVVALRRAELRSLYLET